MFHLAEALSALCLPAVRKPSSSPEASKAPEDILTYVQEHYAQEITLDDVASHVNICKSECCRFFKKYMKMTIFEYVLFLRIQNSLLLLKNGESVTKTAGMADSPRRPIMADLQAIYGLLAQPVPQAAYG